MTSSKDHSCRLWNLDDFSCCGTATGHTDAVGAVCISQREATYLSKLSAVVSGGADKVLKRWNLPNLPSLSHSNQQNVLVCSHSVRGHDKDINTLAMSPNDAMVASGSQDSTIRLWRAQDLSPIATLSGHRKGVWRVCFSPVDKCLASCSGDRTVRLWSLNDYSCLRSFQGHTASVLAVKFINHGMQLVSASSDGLIRLWTIRTGECENTFDKHKDKIWTICVDDKKNRFFTGSSDSTIVEWIDATKEEEHARLDKEEQTILLEQSLRNSIQNKDYNTVYIAL